MISEQLLHTHVRGTRTKTSIRGRYAGLEVIFLYFLFYLLRCSVKGSEKGGGSGGWLLVEDGFGPWRSMYVYFLMLPL